MMNNGTIYTYRNKKTGATFSSPCECQGENWERVDDVTNNAVADPVKKGRAGAPA